MLLTFLGPASSALNAQEWTAEAPLRLPGPGGPGTYWGTVSGVVATRTGFFVFDRAESSLHAFDWSGNRIWSAGRSGAGPGEFRRGSTVLNVGDSLLIVPDIGNSRLTAFGFDGKLRASYGFRNSSGVIRAWGVLGDRLVYLLTPSPAAAVSVRPEVVRSAMVVALDLAGREDTIASVHHEQLLTLVESGRMLLKPRPSQAMIASDGSYVYVGSSSEYRIRRFDASGNEASPVGRSIAPARLTAAEREALSATADRLKQELPPELRSYRVTVQYPTFRSAISRLCAGEGLLLVRTPPERGLAATANAGDPVRWDIFVGGLFAGQVEFPSGFVPHAVTREHVVGTTTSQDGEQTVAVFRLRARSTTRN